MTFLIFVASIIVAGLGATPMQLRYNSGQPLTGTWKWLGISAAIIVAMWCWLELVYKSESAVAERRLADAQSVCANETMAYVMSQNFVRRELKSPSTAKFPVITDVSSSSIGDCKFRVRAYVDAQNSFGATLRTHYSVTMQYNADTERWGATDLQMN